MKRGKSKDDRERSTIKMILEKGKVSPVLLGGHRLLQVTVIVLMISLNRTQKF